MELTGRFALTAIHTDANQKLLAALPRRYALDPQFFASDGKAAEGVWAHPRNLSLPSTIPGANATDSVCHAPLACEAGGTFILRQHPHSKPLRWLGGGADPNLLGNLPQVACPIFDVEPVKYVCMSFCMSQRKRAYSC